jgi:hypothetical protein
VNKDWLTPCRFQNAHGCSIHGDGGQPEACKQFMCLWLASQYRRGDNSDHVMPGELRPDRCHVMFGPAGIVDRNTLFVHVDPAFPRAWQAKDVIQRINTFVARGAFVVVVIDKQRIIFRRGQPPVVTDEATIAQMRLGDAQAKYPGVQRLQGFGPPTPPEIAKRR